MIPYADIPRHELNADQLRERQRWMAEEANRLIEARRSLPRPVETNQIHNPRGTGPTAEQIQVRSVSDRLIAALAERDKRYA